MKKSRGSKQSHVTESPNGILVNSPTSKLKQTPKGKNASVVNRTVFLSDEDEEEKTKRMSKTKAEKSKADEAEMDEDSFLMQRRKGSAKKNRLRVDSSSNDDEEEEEEEEESDEDEDEMETEMDEDEESSDNRADAPIRNVIRKHFIDDEAEEVNVPIDEQDEELTSEDGFIVDDGEDLMTTDDEDEDSDPTAVEGEEEMVTDESSDDDLMGEDRQPETVQGALRMGFEPVNLDAFPFNVEDSLISANKTFAWLISPYDSQKFFNDVYQKTVLYVKRNNRKHYGNLFSAVSLARILEEQYLEYTTNINVALYKDGKRTTLNGKGQAYANVVRDHIQNGCSIQLVNPQTFDDRIWYICELLQELFGCFVGANTYLTPSGSAGFAPHWDDIDAFILQVEGRKHWTVYAPRDAQEELPLESSGNFSPSDLSGRRSVWEGWVETGDMLYVPRGFIHMAKTDPSTHSLHVTLSTGMHHSFANLLKHMMDDALDLLSEMRSKTRRGLPVGYLDMGGVAELPYSNEEQHIQKFVHPLYRNLRALRNMAAERMGDSAIDLMAREFFKTALPPRLTPAERERSALGAKTNLLNKKPLEWSMKNKVRIIRRHTQRLIYENEDTAFIIHRLSNSRIYEGRPETIVEFNIKVKHVKQIFPIILDVFQKVVEIS
ncbi:hypothetical protein WR25_23519 isoform E [Diploscapter pachys]|uniref:Bifunctional lysine-specific demethylase and histidyl-hydroxylase n=1 Tax=Diploscapter pachys TaxID=2018661 RepID=A0A2A2KUQ4_9BILA|nr:hypothetical protein WR25_23519 isoform A [Diploscapter pachys]PAV77682.1 hypothetical protein WR25_23519 isoform B [Diploscapter pachys]PAV77683.1 hypothetical protein WR25_23519 isoform C [Diploscapter pachys]PAV77684.1 hypothetical protein WR25_23519 isoform D [Diploscapter pachys]PAV77685.1 hypothetical protein WR25_23519 isoform E [Diploscapter pachys]